MFWLFATLVLVLVLVSLGPRLLRGRPSTDPHPEAAGDPEPETPSAEDGDYDGGPDPDYEVEIGDELDLHGVPPAEVDSLVDAFIEVSLERRRQQVRIVHGKGIGWMRERVRERLAKMAGVASFADSAAPGSGWGATDVFLKPPATPGAPAAPGAFPPPVAPNPPPD